MKWSVSVMGILLFMLWPNVQLDAGFGSRGRVHIQLVIWIIWIIKFLQLKKEASGEEEVGRKICSGLFKPGSE